MQDWRDAVWRAVPEGAEPERFAERRELLLAHVAAGDRVLDLGCGDGTFAAALTAVGAVVTAVDVSGEAVRRARERAPGAHVVKVDEREALPFDEDSFDLVWAGETLEHVADVTGLLAELRRVLAWGGALIVTTPNTSRLGVALDALRGRPLERRLDPRADHLRFFTGRTLAAMLRDAGFLEVDLSARGGPPGARCSLVAIAR